MKGFVAKPRTPHPIPQFNRSEKLNVYTDCTAAIEAMKAVEKPENITLHSLSEWNG